MEVLMSALESLLKGGESRSLDTLLREAGLDSDSVHEVWNQARQGGFTYSTGFGRDRLTAKGRSAARAIEAE
jgi:hypothetical protein